MKLYEVPRGSKIRVIGDIKTPPEAKEIKEGDILYFSHIDGMYSYCKTETGEVVHLAAWSEVIIVK